MNFADCTANFGTQGVYATTTRPQAHFTIHNYAVSHKSRLPVLSLSRLRYFGNSGPVFMIIFR